MPAKDIKWSAEDVIAEEIIQNVEEKWNITFPELYTKIVTKHNGSIPRMKNNNNQWVSGIVDIPKWASRSACFQLITFHEGQYSRGEPLIVAMNEVFKDSVPDPSKIFAFAQDGAGNLLLFDYRKSSEPSIVFIDH
ncbi:MAG TPA: SMI1/KNR4 family protein [Pseudobacteroides sp.]|uniref:SMI1/KNR4 family protein n=1 Tax=Pseudobacteroides sp. TaxID=1968840 RepID=UPI002F926AE3